MAQDFGNGVSRTLSALQRQYQTVVWQASKPPLDSELNLMSQMDAERSAEAVRAQLHSGFFLDPMAAESDFVTNPSWSNWFKFGRVHPEGDEAPIMWANVNGWIIPVTGTGVPDGDVSNRIDLFNPPDRDTRIDFVFLEVWQAQVAPNPSEVNKPAADRVYKYGNTSFGGTNIVDDIKDPTMGFETTERVQIQYRLRVVGSGVGLGDSVDLAQYPDGMDDPNVIAQGAMGDPVAGYSFLNMGSEMGDRGLWRAGAGDMASRTDLGTVDGYVYAIPVCAVFRRNSSSFVAVAPSGNANQNGGFNRNPVSGSLTDPVQATRTFRPVTLTSDLTADYTGIVSVSGLAGSGLDNVNINWSSVAVEINGEIMAVAAVNAATEEILLADPATSTNPWTGAPVAATAGRGRFGTQAAPHAAASEIRFYCFRPDGLFADQIAETDVHDLRRGITAGEWSYEDILKHNLGKVLDGTLRSSFKQGNGTDTQGTQIIEVDSYLTSGLSAPNQTEQLDGFDGIREVFSDSATVQNNVSLMLEANGSVQPATETWDLGATFAVTGTIPDSGTEWVNNTIIEVDITAARATASGDAFVRFVTPREYWLSRYGIIEEGAGDRGNQTPVLLRFMGGSPATAVEPSNWSFPPALGETTSDCPGPMYPLPEHNFEYPYIVLGGLANPMLTDSGAVIAAAPSAPDQITLSIPGLDFDAPGAWYKTLTGSVDEKLKTDGISNLLLHDSRNLFDLLTNGGKDLTGYSSELYITMSDNANAANNGCFRVIGAGTSSLTYNNALSSNGIAVERLGPNLPLIEGETVVVKFRTQYTNTNDNTDDNETAMAVVLTDLTLSTTLGSASPWETVSLPIAGRAVLDTSLLYGPSRGATARVADHLSRFTLEGSGAYTLLREAPENADPDSTDIRTRLGVFDDEYYYPSQPLLTWNRLSSLGMTAPYAPAYGDGRFNFETLRESELFADTGSKTVVFRPFRQVNMSLPLRVNQADGAPLTDQIPVNYDSGDPVESAGIFNRTHIFALPREYTPRFGRQDIPVRANVEAGGPFFGVNHLFGDSQITSDLVRYIVGGANTSGVKVTTTPMRIQTTSATLAYGEWGGTAVGYIGRKLDPARVNVRSTDVNKPLRGIQLPPYLGIARVYGVYEKSDYDLNGSPWQDEGFTLRSGAGIAPAINLIRTDADKQTLFIMKDGAEDVLSGRDAHTYVVPEEAVNTHMIPGFSDGDQFNDYEYVVEVAVFGFTEGFINRNAYVMLRSDALIEENPNTGLHPNAQMILPAAMGGGVRGYTAYQRTVYQGDPYMTRDGATLQASDYEHRYGQVPVTDAHMVKFPLQQYEMDTDKQPVPETPNARSLEILATVDFWTTLGTGKVGGPVFPGTITDAAYLISQTSRIPETSTENPQQVSVRAFTEGQAEDAPRAFVRITIDHTEMIDQTVVFQRGDLSFSLTYGSLLWPGSTTSEADALNLADAINRNSRAVLIGIYAWATGNTVTVYSREAGTAGTEIRATALPRGTASPSVVDGVYLQSPIDWEFSFVTTRVSSNSLKLAGARDLPVNGAGTQSAMTPLRMTGMTERLPLGILVQDSDFLGEDPLRMGVAYEVRSGGGDQATEAVPTYAADGGENTRLSGPGGVIGMSDGAVLQYTAYNAVSAPDGTKKFRVFRGGGAAYVISPERAGGPVDFTAGGLPSGSTPVLKGAVLAGRAYLVRNGYEQAFTGNVTRSYGDEVQMVIVTNAVYGHGAGCHHGYALDGMISPSDYGKGYAAADRYRLEGKPLVKSRSGLPDANIEIAPYPPEDPVFDPCA